MLERHSMELAEFHAEMTSEIPWRPKFSKELLNLRKVQDTLAKAKQYSDAHKVKLKADRREAMELEKVRCFVARPRQMSMGFGPQVAMAQAPCAYRRPDTWSTGLK